MYGIYNKLTKNIKYLKRGAQYYRNNDWQTTPTNLQDDMLVDF